MSRSHLVSIGRDGWAVWRWFWLRGAGFPASYALDLGDSNLLPALDALHEAETAFRLEKEKATAASQRILDGGDDALKQRADGVLRTFAKNRLVGGDIKIPEIDRHLQAMRAIDATVRQAREAARALMQVDHVRASQRLIDVCRIPALREALTWQNRSAVKNALDRLAEVAPDEDNSRARERKRTVAKYVQRYTLKNDTIGFFGPVSWGRFDPAIETVNVTVGPLAVERWTHFEDWVVGALAEQMSYAPELFPVCSLRLKPFSWLEGNALHRPSQEPVALSEAECTVLALANELQTIDEIVARVHATHPAEVPSIDEGMALVRKLLKMGVAIAQIEIPSEIARKETHLRALLVKAPPSEPRDEALAQLDRLSEDLHAVQQAAGNVDALDPAIEQLESDFTQITARAAKRGHGQAYAGRQIFFEDCRRGGDIAIGRVVLDRIAEPLSLMMQSARWYTFEVARRYRAAFTKRYAELAKKESSPRVPLGTFLVATADLFAHQSRGTSAIVAEVREELRLRWDQLVTIPPDARQVTISAEECRDRAAQLFAAPCPGWPTARYQAPDVLIAAASTEAIAQGDFTTVLGELHAGVNTLMARVAFDMHPERAAAEAAMAADIAAQIVRPVQPTADRTSTIVWAPSGMHVELAQARSWRDRDHVFTGGDLFVQEENGALVVRSRTRDARFDIIEFMDHYLSAEASPHFRVFRDARHMPRVTIDNLVISRERWSLERQEFSGLLAEELSREDRFLMVSSWARDLGLPRFVFAVVPNEPKPFYVDFASQIYVEMFAKFAVRAQRLQLSEMLPAHGQQWLAGEAGERYTSELRIAAVDSIPWSAAAASG